MKLFPGPKMAPFRVRTFLLRYLLPVVAAVIVAPLVLLQRAWPSIRMAFHVLSFGCILLIVISLLLQGH